MELFLIGLLIFMLVWPVLSLLWVSILGMFEGPIKLHEKEKLSKNSYWYYPNEKE